jgi:hypothetical protein
MGAKTRDEKNETNEMSRRGKEGRLEERGARAQIPVASFSKPRTTVGSGTSSVSSSFHYLSCISTRLPRV